MKKKRMTMISIISAIVCCIAVLLFMQALQADANAKRLEAMELYGSEQVDVLVASTDIMPGSTLGASNTVIQKWAAELVPEKSLRSSKDVDGMRLSSAIYAGEIVNENRFAHDKGSLSTPSGYSAISIEVKDVEAVGGKIAPGATVDVWATGSSGTALLGEGIQVLETNVADSDESNAATIEWVSLAVKTDSVQEMISATQTMDIYLSLPSL